MVTFFADFVLFTGRLICVRVTLIQTTSIGWRSAVLFKINISADRALGKSQCLPREILPTV